ncbi:MAG: transport protein TqsA [Mucilaginibacter sp.]|nr:transport protein TqsA [Mucilaginibacter sp.]
MLVKQYPFYFKSTVVLFGLILLVYILNTLAAILIPLAFAVLFSVLLNPLFNRFMQLKVPRAIAVLITLLIGVGFTTVIFYLLSTQLVQFGETFPLLKVRLGHLIDNLEQWIYLKSGISTQKQVAFIKNVIDSSQALIGSTIGTVFGTLSLILLVPVYVFMMLFYKTLILNFLYEVFSEEHSTRVGEILSQTKTAIQSYIFGLLIEMVIVAALNCSALIILDVKYPILLGILGAMINMLPVIGGFIAILLPVLIATVTKDGFSTQIGIIVSYMFIQFVDSNFIFPRFVSLKVQINALISIVAVLLGNAVWGLSGMFLSIPFIAVLKIIFDRVDDLKPWGKLLGHEVPVKHMGQIWGRRRRKKNTAESTPISLTEN